MEFGAWLPRCDQGYPKAANTHRLCLISYRRARAYRIMAGREVGYAGHHMVGHLATYVCNLFYTHHLRGKAASFGLLRKHQS
jgi:hypothetical protein